eukprot:11213189-Lingulodinium_polyedra.AAC.1
MHHWVARPRALAIQSLRPPPKMRPKSHRLGVASRRLASPLRALSWGPPRWLPQNVYAKCLRATA